MIVGIPPTIRSKTFTLLSALYHRLTVAQEFAIGIADFDLQTTISSDQRFSERPALREAMPPFLRQGHIAPRINDIMKVILMALPRSVRTAATRPHDHAGCLHQDLTAKKRKIHFLSAP